jgi:hypothetical protein
MAGCGNDGHEAEGLEVDLPLEPFNTYVRNGT